MSFFSDTFTNVKGASWTRIILCMILLYLVIQTIRMIFYRKKRVRFGECIKQLKRNMPRDQVLSIFSEFHPSSRQSEDTFRIRGWKNHFQQERHEVTVSYDQNGLVTNVSTNLETISHYTYYRPQ